jgi:hypothetical protein
LFSVTSRTADGAYVVPCTYNWLPALLTEAALIYPSMIAVMFLVTVVVLRMSTVD